MCMPVICDQCGKGTWVGCGKHIPAAMAKHEKSNWCTCNPVDDSNSEYPPMFGTGAPTK